MVFKLFKPESQEVRLDSVSFEVHKFSSRKKPGRSNTLIVSCFSEFGCEVLGCMYCIPRVKKRFPGQYVIAMGWHGRDYLYRHLVDEYWEIKDEYMWLRDFSMAFHHKSINLRKLEEEASWHGTVIPSASLGKYAVGNYCITCGKFWGNWRLYSDTCPICKSTNIIRSVLSDTKHYKGTACRIPPPSQEKIEWAKSILKPRTVGIFARARKTYGRNLPADFYMNLVKLLKGLGYNVIFLGEKQNTLACPVDDVIDFSRLPESRNLENTLAIISNLEFTIQFWTASTRLSGILGVPFLLFESPEQIYCSGLMYGQEGKRLELTSFGPKKLVIAHYLNVKENPGQAIEVVRQAVEEMQSGNYGDLIGMVECQKATENLQIDHYKSLR